MVTSARAGKHGRVAGGEELRGVVPVTMVKMESGSKAGKRGVQVMRWLTPMLKVPTTEVEEEGGRRNRRILPPETKKKRQTWR
jgi:hypothetical protein